MFSYSDVEAVYRPDGSTKWARPLFMTSVSAGFPSPAESYIQGHLDLHRHPIQHPGATLVVDRAVEADDGDIVIARINDELCVKRLRVRQGRVWLMPENDKYQPIEVIESMDFEVWGRVMHEIRTF